LLPFASQTVVFDFTGKKMVLSKQDKQTVELTAGKGGSVIPMRL
jgi:hypothetical protein